MTLPIVAILAGGLGTRLGDLTRNLPKSMISIGGRPFLERVIESFATRGFRRFALLTGFGSEMIEAHFGDGSHLGVQIVYSRETTLVGTGGAVRDAQSLLGDRFVLTYGDLLRYHDYDAFVASHPRRSCLAIYEYASGLSTIDSGNVSLNEDGTMVAKYAKGGGLRWVDAGFALITNAIDLLPRVGACSFEQTLYPELARRGELEAEVVDRDFHDIGNLRDLDATRTALEEK